MDLPFSDIRLAIETLTSAFQDASNANVCAMRMRVAADMIDAFSGMETMLRVAEPTTVELSPELLRAGVMFATRKRSAAEYRALVDRLCVCRCDFTQPGTADMHVITLERPGRQGDDTVPSVQFVLQALHTLGCLAYRTVSRLAPNTFFNNTDLNESGQLMWPQNLTDMHPYGVEGTADSLDLWLRQVDGHIVFPLAVAFGAFCTSFKTSLIRPPDYTLALVRPLQHLTAITERQFGWRSNRKEQEYFNYCTWIIFTFMGLLDEGAEAWRIMLTSPSGTTCLRSSLPILLKLRAVLPTILKADFPNKDAASQKLQLMIDYGKGYFNEGGLLDCTLNHAEAIGEVRAQCAGQAPSAAHKFFVSLALIKDTHRGTCLNISCPDISKACQFKCSQCKLVRFCGEQCQKEAWKHKFFPHKTLCLDAHALREKLGPDDWERIVSDSVSVQEFEAIRATCTRKGALRNVLRLGSMLDDAYTCQEVAQMMNTGE